MSGFGKGAGPTPSSLSQPRFGPPSSSSPPPLTPSPHFALKAPQAAGSLRLPALAYETSAPVPATYHSAGIPKRPDASERVRPPPLAFQHTCPSPSPPYPSVGSHGWVNGQTSFLRDDTQMNQRPSTVTSFVASLNSGSSVTAKVARFQDLKRTRSPPSHSMDEDVSGNFTQAFLERPALSPPARNNQAKLPAYYPTLLAHQEQSSVLPHVGSYDAGRSLMNEVLDVHGSKRTRSSPANVVYLENTPFVQKEYKRPSVSPPRLGHGSNALFNTSDSQNSQRPLPLVNATAEAAPTSTTSFPVAKRTRSPPLRSNESVSQGNSYSAQDDIEREMQAKAKRLARFKEELSENFENSSDIADQKVAVSRREQSIVERQNISSGYPAESVGHFTNGNTASDSEGLETSSVIVGLCPDMCPESERAERERKGDLDQYERLDGDRNQTNKSLAVKKYNRTAERVANLIRPMPILQKTIDYLLNLLDQPYNDRLLGMYNFLWDRMRAIRMDLRMQHIFNLDAITMLEKMIRLHIIAMHELCEYTKGEGFSEGFDAHLNIEQMNKTSVELFQMYDDHRKKGINVPTEKEFRGYYALLKLDKHPGYKVEPAELSLDLAKMTPDIRQTSEVLFARDVARACRTSNFIAFFRLARKASYLQACLMHAHFAKLRTQALASLHSGLQNNQGLPVTYVANWLTMEAEDMESLLEYHGFLIKDFEEPYMVREGPFLNGDKDYPTKCSKLVHLKKSSRMVEDVSPTFQAVSSTVEATKKIQLPKIYKHDTQAVPSVFVDGKTSVAKVVEEMPDSEVISSQKLGTQLQPTVEKSVVTQHKQDDHKFVGAPISLWGFPLVHSSPKPPPSKLEVVEKPNHDALYRASPKRRMLSEMEGMPLQIESRKALQERSPSGKYGRIMENTIPQTMVFSNLNDEEASDINQENDDEVAGNYKDEEVAQAKLKLIVRLWRRNASKQRELRERRQIAANAALSSIPLGPLIRYAPDQPSAASRFDIDHVMKERFEKREQSWSRLNVSNVIGDILGRRNPEANCLYWKIILCSQINGKEGDKPQVPACSWLFSKLLPSRKENNSDDDDLLISSPGLAIWRKWVPSQSGNSLTCCISVVKEAKFGNLIETVAGASAVLFLVSDSVPWNLQKIQLHNLLLSIPSGSFLPLLVISDSYCKDVSNPSSIIVSELGLHDMDKSRVNRFLVVFLGHEQMGHLDGFFCDIRLREGLQWLANESPLQPDLHCTKTRDLVLMHLNPSLDVLEKMSDYEVHPSHCISAFNEALDWSLDKIAATAEANSGNYPCPEIALLEDFCAENMMLKWYLPSVGWSSASRIEPLLCAIRACKLPTFPDAMSWLNRGANMRIEIDNLKSQLENCLVQYLTQSSRMMGYLLAEKEAHVMLQTSARLELHDSSYHIVPKWVKVFRRIFSWQLTSLSCGVFASAYVLKAHLVNPMLEVLGELELEGSVSTPYLNEPSLDEVIDASFSSLLLGSGQPQPEAFQPPPRAITNGDAQVAAETCETTDNERNFAQDGNLFDTDNVDHENNGLNTFSTEIVVPGKATKEADKLSKLLKQWNIVQNSIDEKLYIYF